MVYKFLIGTRSGNSLNEQLAEELHKQVSKKSKRRKVYARYKNNISVADLAEMESLSSKNKSVKYAFTNHAWVKPLKDKKGKTVLNTFIEIVNESNRKGNKSSVDQGREFYNKFMQEWLDNIDILMHSTHNEGKSVVAERFIKTLKLKSIKKWQLIIVNLILVI